jgi:hypothetical protein
MRSIKKKRAPLIPEIKLSVSEYIILESFLPMHLFIHTVFNTHTLLICNLFSVNMVHYVEWLCHIVVL